MPEPSEICPICAKPRARRFKPFCSQRCAEIDLGRWLGGKYAIAGVESAESGEKDEKPVGEAENPQ